MALVFWLARADGLTMMSSAVPDVLVWASTFEVSIWLDALAAILIIGGSLRVKFAAGFIQAKITWVIQRCRRRPTKRDRHPHKLPGTEAGNDDEDDPAKWGLAA